MKNNRLQKLVIGSLCLVCNSALCETNLVTYFSTGLLYSNGNASLGDINNKTFSTPFMLSTSYQQMNASLATSYIRDESDITGISDTTLSLSYDFSENSHWSIMLKEKFATGDKNKGFSTGENDTSLELDYFTPLNDKVSFMGSIGHTFVGKPDQPFGSNSASSEPLRNNQQQGSDNSNNTGQATGAGRNTPLQDSSYTSIGVAYKLSDKTNLGMLVDYQQSIFKSLDDETGLSLFVNQSLSSNWSVSGLLAYDSLQMSSLGITLTTRFE